jgi:hypothetical protein
MPDRKASEAEKELFGYIAGILLGLLFLSLTCYHCCAWCDRRAAEALPDAVPVARTSRHHTATTNAVPVAKASRGEAMDAVIV